MKDRIQTITIFILALLAFDVMSQKLFNAIPTEGFYFLGGILFSLFVMVLVKSNKAFQKRLCEMEMHDFDQEGRINDLENKVKQKRTKSRRF